VDTIRYDRNKNNNKLIRLYNPGRNFKIELAKKNNFLTNSVIRIYKHQKGGGVTLKYKKFKKKKKRFQIDKPPQFHNFFAFHFLFIKKIT